MDVIGTTEVVTLTPTSSMINYTENVGGSFSVQDNFGPITESLFFSDTIDLNNSLTAGILISLLDNGFSISDSMSVVWTPVPLSDSFIIDNEIEFTITAHMYDVFSVASSFGSVELTSTLKSTIRVSELLKTIIIVTLSDTIAVSDVREMAIISSLASNLFVQDTWTTTLNSNIELSDSFSFKDTQALGLAESLTSTGLFTESISHLVTQLQLLTDSLTVSDVRILSATVSEELASALKLTESLSFAGSVYNIVLLSTVEMGDLLWAPDFGAVAWVMNTEGESIAPYLNFGFHSIAAKGGKVFATSPMGIYELTGNTDDGRNIDANVKYGFEDFGVPNLKRASDVYLSYTGGLLECGIETYDGPKSVYNYPIEDRDATAPRNNRMKVGRGLVSRYWRTQIRNLEGASFKVYEVGINATSSKRRL